MTKELMDSLWVFLVTVAFYAGWIVASLLAAKKISRLEEKVTRERQYRLKEDGEIIIDLTGKLRGKNV